MSMTQRILPALGPQGFHRIAYTEWGSTAGRRPLVCVHGMTRNGRDFDPLAAALSDRWRVVCPDIVGRGRSEWLADPQGYGYAQYVSDMAMLIARLDTEQVDWVGTSMGGVIGMALASRPNSPIRRLVINDIGPFIPGKFLGRLRRYVGKVPHLADMAAVEEYLRQVHAPFGPLTGEQWRHLATHSARPLAGGGFGLAYDPGIAEAAFTKAKPDDVEMWDIWDRITCPVLVLRGASSDLLLPDTVDRMRRRGPQMEAVEIPGCGHAPALMAADQIALVRAWLER